MNEFELYDRRQSTEHELINRKLTWLFSSQSILFAALAFVLGKEVKDDYKDSFLQTICPLGVCVSIFIFIGVFMCIIAKRRSWKDSKDILEKEITAMKQSSLPSKASALVELESQYTKVQYWGVRNSITKLALIPDVLMPLAFAAAWIYLWWRLG
jgi:hypothetical protein